jgi:hypothetical protein
MHSLLHGKSSRGHVSEGENKNCLVLCKNKKIFVQNLNRGSFCLPLYTASPRYPLTLNSSFLISVGCPLTLLFPYLSSVSFIHRFFNHLAFVNVTHRVCNRAARFSLPTALPLFGKPVVH